MMYLCQREFGQNLTIGSEERVQTGLSHRYMSLMTLEIRSRSPKPNCFLGSNQ